MALALVKVAECDGADHGADETPDLEPCGEEESSYLPVSSFVEHDLEPGSAAGRLAETAHLDRERGLPFDHESAPAHRIQIVLTGEALDSDDVGLGDGSRVHEALREAGVVAEQEQAFGVLVEASDRNPVAVVGWQELEDGVRAGLADPGDDDLAGLVEGEDPRQSQIPPAGRNAVS